MMRGRTTRLCYGWGISSRARRRLVIYFGGTGKRLKVEEGGFANVVGGATVTMHLAVSTQLGQENSEYCGRESVTTRQLRPPEK